MLYAAIPASCFIRQKDTGRVEESHWTVSSSTPPDHRRANQLILRRCYKKHCWTNE